MLAMSGQYALSKTGAVGAATARRSKHGPSVICACDHYRVCCPLGKARLGVYSKAQAAGMLASCPARTMPRWAV